MTAAADSITRGGTGEYAFDKKVYHLSRSSSFPGFFPLTLASTTSQYLSYTPLQVAGSSQENSALMTADRQLTPSPWKPNGKSNAFKLARAFLNFRFSFFLFFFSFLNYKLSAATQGNSTSGHSRQWRRGTPVCACLTKPPSPCVQVSRDDQTYYYFLHSKYWATVFEGLSTWTGVIKLR